MAARWEHDERGGGIGSAVELGADIDELRAAIEHGTWVAEDADAHLLPHLQAACSATPSWTLRHAETIGSRFDVHLEWSSTSHSLRELRRDAFALLGAVAESSTYVRQRVADEGAVVFDVVTGMVGDDTRFAPHGHVIRLVVVASHKI